MAGKREKFVIGSIRRLLNGTARMSRRQAGKIGFYLLSKPRRAADEPLSDAFMRTAERYTVNANGTKLQCFHWPGKGPSVLLLHGWESNSGRWFAFFEPLRRAGYSIYAFDAPAHGRSGGKRFNALIYAEALQCYLQHHGFAPDYWIGHSAGGMAAIWYLTEMEAAYEPQQLVSLAVPGELENFIDKFCDFVGVHEKVKRGIDEQFRRKLDVSFTDISFIKYVKNLRVPGLIVHDECDDLAPIDGAYRMHENWAGSSLITTRDCGHSLIGDLVPAMVLEYLRHCRVAR
ncbi:alpha/beta fold hydrolase [Lewinella sp. JB7]|uniref:alpha/beta fold hydrolase n=1 Tax=Lewinella sp. JB7 TaxID=2962887 RepID=UPI0020C9751C|nr:alpha/beta hydrolase [Lewinella sp. JB7]MCP9234410.1 alpha/beta hydrolase [Lewinella sp. JB7]